MLCTVICFSLDKRNISYFMKNHNKSRKFRCTGCQHDGEIEIPLVEATEELAKYFRNIDNPTMSRRCAAVLIKVIRVSKISRFPLEINTQYREDLQFMRFPITFQSIITKVLHAEFEDEDDPALEFCWDMRHFLLSYLCQNEYAYNSSLHQLLIALYRHVDQWLISSPEFRPVETCDDFHCLLSNQIIPISKEEITSISCSRCSGVFSLSYLDAHTYKHSGLYDISTELVTNSKEMWICPLCLQDDSSGLVMNDQLPIFFLNEWGFSSLIPWALNPSYSSRCYAVTDDALESLFLLSDCRNFPTFLTGNQLHTKYNVASLEMDDSVLHGNAKARRRKWTCEEHLSILSALAEVVLKDTKMQSWFLSCLQDLESLETLEKTVAFGHHQDAEKYLDIVKSVVGDKVSALIRFKISPFQLTITRDHSIILESYRKFVDRRYKKIGILSSTEKLKGENSTVILCDICGIETHLSFSNQVLQQSVESKRCKMCEYLYDRCDENIKHISKIIMERIRRQDVEDELASRRVLQKVDKDCFSHDRQQQDLCMYCGKREDEICSPFVMGQNIFEFICGQSRAIKKKFPSLPCIFHVMKEENIPVEYTGFPVVHEICALQMHEHRISNVSGRNFFSDAMKWTTDEVIRIHGLSLKPLGFDDDGRMYWKLPGLTYLYLSYPYIKKIRFDGRDEKKSSAASSFVSNVVMSMPSLLPLSLVYDSNWPCIWYILSDPNNIRIIICNLGNSSNEISLKFELLKLVPNSRDSTDFNMALQNSTLSMSFMAKYCRYDQLSFRSHNNVDLEERTVDIDDFCYVNVLENFDIDHEVQSIEFIYGEDEWKGSPIEPHIILEGHEDISFIWNDSANNLCYVNSRFKYYHIRLLDCEGAKIYDKEKEINFKIIFQVLYFVSILSYSFHVYFSTLMLIIMTLDLS